MERNFVNQNADFLLKVSEKDNNVVERYLKIYKQHLNQFGHHRKNNMVVILISVWNKLRHGY